MRRTEIEIRLGRGEPFKSFFEPNQLAEQVRQLGFAEVSDFGPDEAAARYFAGRTDGLRPLASEHLMRARVGVRSDWSSLNAEHGGSIVPTSEL
jgi:hypothetical protein